MSYNTLDITIEPYRFTVRLSSGYKQARLELSAVAGLLKAKGYNWDIHGVEIFQLDFVEMTVIDCYDEDEAIKLEQEINDLLTELRVMTQLESYA